MNKNLNILITGGLGYVGTELCKLYAKSKHNITVVDNAFIPERVRWLIENNLKYFQRDLFNISDLLKDCDICYHLAGITNVPLIVSQSSPEKDAEIIKVGTDGTKYIIDNINKNCKIIFASTQLVFDGLTYEKFNIDENFEPCPSVAYSVSKTQSEKDFFNSNKNFIIARFASAYGYNEAVRWKNLPNLFSKMVSQKQTLRVFGAENNKPFIGINDLARCIYFLAHNSYNKEIFNCVSENVKVVDIANFCKKCDKNTNIIITNEEVPNKGFTLSNKKILDAGFVFKQTLKEEIDKMIKMWSNK